MFERARPPPPLLDENVAIEWRLDFEGDLYGAEVETTFVQKLRDERKFPSLEALREQIDADIRAARSLFANAGA